MDAILDKLPQDEVVLSRTLPCSRGTSPSGEGSPPMSGRAWTPMPAWWRRTVSRCGAGCRWLQRSTASSTLKSSLDAPLPGRDRVGPLSSRCSSVRSPPGAVTASLERISADGADANAAGMALWNEAADQPIHCWARRIERFAARRQLVVAITLSSWFWWSTLLVAFYSA